MRAGARSSRPACRRIAFSTIRSTTRPTCSQRYSRAAPASSACKRFHEITFAELHAPRAISSNPVEAGRRIVRARMRSMIRRYALLVILLLLASPAAFAMRCGSRIVDVGTQDFQVRERCGEPFYTDTYYATEVFGNNGPVAQYRDVQYDVWYYNFGPSTLMRRFVFRDGVLAREETLGYGVNEIGEDCNPNRDYRGVSIGELVARCG